MYTRSSEKTCYQHLVIYILNTGTRHVTIREHTLINPLSSYGIRYDCDLCAHITPSFITQHLYVTYYK